MKYLTQIFIVTTFIILLQSCQSVHEEARIVYSFNENWKFHLGDDATAKNPDFDDSEWRVLNLPHDWSIEGTFSESHSTTPAGGALPAGIGWYRKSFECPESLTGKQVRIEFDGVYQNSEVWINGHYLGIRPFGYMSFQYDITPYLKSTGETNVIAVRVDNSDQPNSRWYTGSGIYRNVRLTGTSDLFVAHWGTFVTTPKIDDQSAEVNLEVTIENRSEAQATFSLVSTIYDQNRKRVARSETPGEIEGNEITLNQEFVVNSARLWSPDSPNMYRIVTELFKNGELVDNYETPLGIRYFHFDAEKGFFLNGEHLKILGACLHHDLGALGAAYNRRANERQLEIMKEMGVNAIRTAHNPFDPQFYELCDEMGLLVMDEAFDEWVLRKARRGYHLFYEEWHERDIKDMVLRSRNHPSVFMYSIGNEIREQFDSTGLTITPKLVRMVKEVDPTRPVTCALTENQPELNFIAQSGALDVLGFNYKHEVYDSLMNLFPGEKILATENVSGLATRGHYDMPSDSVRIWPTAHNAPLIGANHDYTVSSYDNAHAYWGSTHADNWRMIKKHEYVSGVFIWTGIDYLGEPTPYPYPARSSYFGVVDLAGFPKDTYYMYQSEWSDQPMLHLFPHWNWEEGQTVDVWAYYNQADEVELFLNGESMGVMSKNEPDFHVMWRIPFKPGTLKAVSRKNGQEVLIREINTAGAPAKIELIADREVINADGVDLSFVTVRVTDDRGNMVPDAGHLINFNIGGNGFIAGVDNGYQASLEPFKANYRRAFKGKCLAIVQNNGQPGEITLTATAEGLESSRIVINCK